MKCELFNHEKHVGVNAFTDTSRIVYSEFRNYDIRDYAAPTVSIKYVFSGTEYYHVNKKKVRLNANKFLIVNHHCPIDTFINSRKLVTGFCIHLQPDLLRNVWSGVLRTQESCLDDPFQKIELPLFDPVIYSEKENELGRWLSSLRSKFNKQHLSIEEYKDHTFQTIARLLVSLQGNVPAESKHFNVCKASTRSELLRRLNIAKEMMNDVEIKNLNLREIARNAMLSPSHLSHTFAKVYGTPVYRYFLQRRLELARQLLCSHKMSVIETSLECGFPDISSFSRAFKKHYGLSPRNYLLKHDLPGKEFLTLN